MTALYDAAGRPLQHLTRSCSWLVTSASAGAGVARMVDARSDTYWQSDGPQPHTITGVSPVARRLVQVRLLVDYGADKSYTPPAPPGPSDCQSWCTSRGRR